MTTVPENPAAHLPDRFLVDSPDLRAEISARTPIRFTADGEPYLPLPAPYEQFYLGPERVSDIPHDVAMMSDIRVARTLVGPPFPVPLIGSQRWLVRERADTEALFSAYAQGKFRPAAVQPFSVLRERKPEGTEDVYVGQVTIMRGGGKDARRTPAKDHWEEWRDRERVWEIGAALNVDYHGRGLASAATRVIFEDWAVAQMGCTEIHAEMLASNIGSVRLWQKLGFIKVPELRSEVKIDEAKGGGVEQGCVYLWHLE